MKGEFRDVELDSFTQPEDDAGLGGDTWHMDRVADSDFNVRYHGRQYKLYRQHRNQGWVCGYLSSEDLYELREMCDRVLATEK